MPCRIMKTCVLLLAVAYAVASADETPAVAIRSAICTTQIVQETLIAYGTVQAALDQVVSVSLPHAGLISRVRVSAGRRVAKGDILLELITAPEAQSEYAQAKASADYARQELARQQRLISEQLTTQSDLDAAQKNRLDAEAALDALVKRKQELIEDTIKAPMDGIILKMDVAPGQQVQAGSAVILMASEAHLVVKLGAEPEDLAEIHPGMPVNMRSVFASNYQVTSSVQEVHAMIDPGTHLVDVLVPVPPTQTDHLVLGSRMIGEIELHKRNALLVPRSAVLDDEQGSYLFVIENGKARRKAVQKGLIEATAVEVSGDIQAGDRIVVIGNYELADGMTVREITR